MDAGTITFSTVLDNTQLEKGLVRLKKKIESIEKDIVKSTSAKTMWEKKADGLVVQLDAAKAKLYEMQNAQRGAFSSEQIDAQKETVNALQAQWTEAQDSVDGYNKKISDAAEKLNTLKEKAGQLAQESSTAGGASTKMGKAIDQAGEYADKFATRIKRLASRVFAFTLITTTLKSLQTWLGDVIKSNNEARAVIAKLKGALLTLVQPLVNVLIPAFTAFVSILSKAISLIAQVVSMLFGTTASASAKTAEELYNEINAIEGVGAAAEEATGSLAGFDEINQLSSESASGTGGASAYEMAPDFSGEGDLTWLSETLGSAAGWVTAALLLGGIALVAIGACTGNLTAILAGLLLIGATVTVGTETGVFQSWVDTLGLNSVAEFVALAILLGGIAIVAIGAATGNILAVIAGLALIGATILYTEQSGMMESWTEEQLSRAASYVTAALLLGGIALVVIGAATGNILMTIAGLGLLAAGVYVGVESGTLKSWAEVLGLDSVFDYVAAGIQLAGIALVAIGAAMGNIVMVIAGAVILAAGVTAELIGEEALKSWWEVLQLTSVQQWVSVALLLGGIALIAVGAAMGNIMMILAGFGLLAVGTIDAASEGNLKDWVTTLGLEKAAGWVTAGLLIGGLALIIFGILTANILMVIAGLGLLGAGVSVGVTSGTFGAWLDTIAGAFISFKNKVVDIFTELQAGLKGIINGIIGGIEWLANKVIDGINFVTNALNNLSFTVPDWVPALGGQKFGFNIPKLSSVSIPRLATGAVIPPNREFLAVLGDQKSGTNIEAPLSTIEQALENVLARTGGMGGDINITVESVLDGKVVARNTVKHINDMTRQAGKPVLLF